jgi:non-canonical (house-cleaning) NTP pyrophosphatase
MYNTMSNSSQNFSSSQKIPQEATQQKKLTKIAARYIELEQFKDSDHHKGYFCYNCTYFVKPHHCAIVTDEGMDILGRSSGVIAPHGLCSLWIPNEEEIHGSSVSRSDKSDESTPGVSASFSCDFCNKSFNSREELRQHSTQEHSR